MFIKWCDWVVELVLWMVGLWCIDLVKFFFDEVLLKLFLVRGVDCLLGVDDWYGGGGGG